MKADEEALTAERLRELLDYDPDTGVLTNKVARGNRKLGDVVGCPHSQGYLRVVINRAWYYAHRLVWLHTYGAWPANHIDHINGIRTDNRVVNLREANNMENAENRRKPKHSNETGLLGVSLEAGKFRGRISSGGKKKHLGYYSTKEEAYTAYISAKRELHPFCTI